MSSGVLPEHNPATTALAFRGYNTKNLGRTPELLRHPVFGGTVERYLAEASEVLAETTGRKHDIVSRVRNEEDTSIDRYPEAIAMIVAVEMCQLELLRQYFGVDHKASRLAMGFSLGEVSALSATGIFPWREGVQVPLSLAEDCAALAENVTLGVLFSRGQAIAEEEVDRLCLKITAEGNGVVAVSTYLSPNTYLLLGQNATIDRFRELLPDVFPPKVSLRKNTDIWPPLHTPIVWEKYIAERCGSLLHTLPGGFREPDPPILSMVTGDFGYNSYNARRIIREWTFRPQHVWTAVYETLSLGIETVIHVGPQPNLLPSTYRRLSDNVMQQINASVGVKTLSVVRPWLQGILPERTALLRAPLVRHINLEDWLLDQELP